ncbi:MAG: hypothetical protein H0W78_14535 [Planctomycetes bacterium]|nr:hypothetical protein [Planctomycetota bacterium]
MRSMMVGLVGLVGMGGALFAVESPEPLWVDRIPVRPGGNLIYDEGRLELHPKLLLGLGYDSNVDATATNPDDDVYARGVAGVVVYWLPAIADRFSADVQVDAKRYLDRDDRDFTGGRLRLGWTRESALGPLATVVADGMLVDDPLIETGRQVQRARYEGQAGWWMRGTSNVIRLGVGAVGEDYREDAGVFDERERDYLRPQATIEWWYGRADGPTRLGLRLAGDRIDYREAGSPYQDGSGVALIGLVRHHFTPLLQLNGHLGIEHRRYADDFSGDPAFDDQTITRPVGELLLRWDPEEYSRLDLGIGSVVVPTIDANAAYLVQAWMHGRWRLQRSLGVLAEVNVFALERSGTATGATPNDLTLRVRAGVEIWARDGLVIRALGGTDIGEPENGAGYHRLLGTLDTVFLW